MLIEAQRLEKTFRAALLATVGSLLHREYRQVRAVRDVSFGIERGEMVRCLGPNGAGKSTTIKMLSGILVCSGGQVEVFRLVPHRRRRQVAQRIGVVFGQRTQLWWDLPLTVLLTTHDISDVERLCSRVYGMLPYDGTLDAIRDRLGTERTLVVDLTDDVPRALEVSNARDVCADRPRHWLQFNRVILSDQLLVERPERDVRV